MNELAISVKKKIVDKVYRNDDLWICGKCNTSNDLSKDFCKKCGKEFWPE
jgi:ribosomal protein L40E